MNQVIQGLTLIGDSAVMISGVMASPSGTASIYVGAFDVDGNLAWDKHYSSSPFTVVITDMLATSGGIELVGSIGPTSISTFGFHGKLDESGLVIFAKQYGTTGATYPGKLFSIIAEDASGSLIVGFAGITGTYEANAMFVSTDAVPANDCEVCGDPITLTVAETSVNYVNMALSAQDGYTTAQFERISSPVSPAFEPCLLLDANEIPYSFPSSQP